LEAERQTGGRVYSHYFDEAKGLDCELGGEWIGKDHKRMRQLCKDFHLPLQDHSYTTSFWDGTDQSRTFGPTTSCFSTKTERRFTRFCNAFKKYGIGKLKYLDSLDWWTCLEKEVRFTIDECLRRDLGDSTDFGETIRQVSAYVAASEYSRSNPTDEMDWKVVGGNSLLIKALVTHIKGRHGEVHTRASVRRIEQDEEGVHVHVDGKKNPFHADRCVCATPAHCLTNIDWDPPLPKDKSRAAEELQYSRITKSAVLYQHRFWNSYAKSGFGVFTSRVSDFCFDSTFLQRGDMGILTSYAVGDKADDVAAEENQNNVMNWITQDMVSVVRPSAKIVVAPIAIETQAWQRRQWVGGAYAFYRPGQWFTIQPALLRKFRRIRFAGEHLSEKWSGFMEGAVETGENAAKSLP
jgi:monoamine oxidase